MQLKADVVLKSSVEYLKSHRRHLSEDEGGGDECEDEGCGDECERRELNAKAQSGNKLHVRKGKCLPHIDIPTLFA